MLTLDWGGWRPSSFSAALPGRWGLQRIHCLHLPPLSWLGCPTLLPGPPGGGVWWDCPETAGAVRLALSVVKHSSESSATVYSTSNSIAKDTARLTVFTRPVFTRPVVNSHQLWDRQTIFTVRYCDSQSGVKYQMEYKHAKSSVHLVSSGLTFTCLGCLKFISDTVKVDGFIGCKCACVWVKGKAISTAETIISVAYISCYSRKALNDPSIGLPTEAPQYEIITLIHNQLSLFI